MRKQLDASRGTFGRMRPPIPLALEAAAARAAGSLSRLAGRGGGTTLPGKLLWKLDPGAIDRLAARLPQGSVLISATNGKTTTAAMAAEILRPRVRLAHNNSGANLVSGVASTLLRSRGAELGLFEADEAALSELARRLRPKALLLCNLFRDQLDRYGELELVAARWRDGGRGAARRAARRQRRRSAGRRPRTRPAGLAHLRRSTTHGTPAPSCSTRPTRSTACAAGRRTTTPPRTSATSATIAARTAATRGRRSTSSPARSSCTGSTARAFTLVSPAGEARVELALPGLYNVYNALAAASLCTRARGPGRRDRRRARTFLGRVRALRADRDRRPAAPDAPDQEPGRRERGGAHDRRRRRAQGRRRRAQRRDRRRPRRLLDLGRRLRAAARRPRHARRHRLPCGGAGAAVRLRRAVARTDRGRPVARSGARPRARADPEPAASSRSSPPTPRCSRCAESSPARGHVSNYWASAA